MLPKAMKGPTNLLDTGAANNDAKRFFPESNKMGVKKVGKIRDGVDEGGGASSRRPEDIRVRQGRCSQGFGSRSTCP